MLLRGNPNTADEREESWNILKGTHKDHQIQLLALNRTSQNATMFLGALSKHSLGSGRAVSVTTALRSCSSAQLGEEPFPKIQSKSPLTQLQPFLQKGRQRIKPPPVLIPVWNWKTKRKSHSPILLLRFGSSIGTTLPILGGHVAALFEGSIPVLEDVLDAEFLPLQAGLGAGPGAEGAGQGLLRPRHRGQAAPARWQHVNADPVHAHAAEPGKGGE